MVTKSISPVGAIWKNVPTHGVGKGLCEFFFRLPAWLNAWLFFTYYTPLDSECQEKTESSDCIDTRSVGTTRQQQEDQASRHCWNPATVAELGVSTRRPLCRRGSFQGSTDASGA